MQTLYLDVFSGISGDMFLGALLDLGVDFRELERGLRRLKLDGYHLHVARGAKASIAGTKFDVHLDAEHSHSHGHDHGAGCHEGCGHDHGHGHGHSHEPGSHQHSDSRDFAAIRQLILASSLSDWVKEHSLAVFHRIAVAEGKIHGVPPEQVHFHEVGAVDSIVDIVGACLGLELLGKPRVLAAPVVEGTD